MAAPMRSGSQDSGHRARVADSSNTGNATAKPDIALHTPTTSSSHTASNFEYDDNEWDIGIGDLIIDLDADIEKTTEKSSEAASMAANAAGPQATKAAAAKMAVEHSATVDKGLKMKIKRTKPGTKTSEAKHEIVKSNEQNGSTDPGEMKNSTTVTTTGGAQLKHATTVSSTPNNVPPNSVTNATANSSNGKRGSSGHRRDKARDKHDNTKQQQQQQQQLPAQKVPSAANVTTDLNGMIRASAPPQPGPPRPLFPASTGPGPPSQQCVSIGPSPGPPPSPAAATAPGSAAKPEQAKVAAAVLQPISSSSNDERSSSPPPAKKLKSDTKEVNDVCIGTSVGTITEPDCLGPCEPGTSVTLEGIVWHETEGGVLVVNVTWRGKTYVGTLLDCTQHDWAPPRFCDSPTSDLDNRTPKGRETRSSVHSKLRNGGGGVKGRRGAANGSGPSTAPSSPTPFIPPRPEPNNKRKNRTEEDSPQPSSSSGKKTKVIIPPPIPPIINPPTSTTTTPCTSPPPSPVLLECPEPNCSKKYKHINGLKYHQSHAHGSADDDDTKDVTSMSENDESNIEAPSPVAPAKSPEKSQDSPLTPQKKDVVELPMLLRASGLLEVPSQPSTPLSTPPSPVTPQCLQEIGVASSPTVPTIVDSKNVVKPSVLRYSTSDDFSMGVFSSNKSQVPGTPISSSIPPVRNVGLPTIEQAISTPEPPVQPQSFANQLPPQVMSSQQFTQPPSLIIPSQPSAQMTTQLSPHSAAPQSPSPACKIPSFKVKPAAALMPDDKKIPQSINQNKPQNFKKKSRKSPAENPHLPHSEQGMFGVEQNNRDDVQSPAYSDISDDGAPVIETEINDKNKASNKKTEIGQPLPHMSQYYPYYGQPQYMVPPVQQPQEQNKPKEPEKLIEKPAEKEVKKETPEYPPKVVPHNYYQYGYMPNYPYSMEPNYSNSTMVQEEKIKEERMKESPSPIEQTVKQPTPIPNPIQVPNPGKVKQEPIKDKHQNENHQIIKESIEIKNQMNPYNMYQRPQPQQSQQPPTSHHSQRDEDARRFYLYDPRRKEHQTSQHQQNMDHGKVSSSNKQSSSSNVNLKPYKEPKIEDKKEKDVKQEGVKPTMETQGPPPPPTSQYAYIHPSYMQQPHFGALPFDPNHPMYRGIMVPGPYGTSPYLHHQMPRYHAAEDLRTQPPTKALDMLQSHAQYYSQHKIHELQERAIKSPTPKTTTASSSPSTNQVQQPSNQQQLAGPPVSQASNNSSPSIGGKQQQAIGENKDSRSPPPQRHVHTHHHTHVGLGVGYPMYPNIPNYGAAVLASQQAAAVTVINPYPTK